MVTLIIVFPYYEGHFSKNFCTFWDLLGKEDAHVQLFCVLFTCMFVPN